MSIDNKRARLRAAGAIFGAILGDIYATHETTRSFITDQMILAGRSLVESFNGYIENTDCYLARSLLDYQVNGICGNAPLPHNSLILSTIFKKSMFINHPREIAKNIILPDDNISIIRAIPCAFTVSPEEWTRLICQTTHSSLRCLAVSLTLNHMLYEIMIRDVLSYNMPINPIIFSCQILDKQTRCEYIKQLINTKKLDDIKNIDDTKNVFNISAIAIWTFHQIKNKDISPNLFKQIIAEVSSKGGDVRTNCATAGSIIGSILGAKNLPADWYESIPIWIKNDVDKFISASSSTWYEIES